jgi:hypothetical protein
LFIFASSAAVVGLIIVVVMSTGFSVCVYIPSSSSDEPAIVAVTVEDAEENGSHFFGASVARRRIPVH